LALPNLPAANLFTTVGVKNGPAKASLDAILEILAQHYDISLPLVATLDVSGRISPSSANLLVQIYNSNPSANSLNTIDLAAVPDGRSIRIAAANPLQPIIVVDTFNGGAGGGEIIIDPAGDVPFLVLDDITKSLVLKRSGNSFYVSGSTGFPPKGALTTPIQTNIDFNGYGASGISLLEKDITTPTYGPTVDDRGFLLDVNGSCIVTFPNPNDVSDPDPNRHWKRGQTLIFFQQGASLSFLQYDGSTPLNAFNHDAGYAPGALITAKVYKVAFTSTLAFTIFGQTDTSGGGGGGGGGAINRSYSYLKVASDYVTPSDIAWHAAGSLAGFTPQASSKYLFLVSYGIKNSGSTASNASLTRVVIAGTPDTEIFHAGSDRYPQHTDRVMAAWGATFGASPAAMTLRVDAKNSSGSYTTTISAISFLALKLGANEDYANDAGPHTSSSNSYVDCCTLNLTSLPNDEYYFIAAMEYDTSAVGVHAEIRLLIGGTEYTAFQPNRNSLQPGLAFMVKNLTLSGSVTAKIQIRVLAGDTGNVTSNYASITCLAKASFQRTFVDSDTAEQSFASTAYSARLNDDWALDAGYNFLLLANSQAKLDASGGTYALKTNFTMNGGNLVPDAAQGTRQDGYCSNSYGAMAVKKPAGATDNFKLSFAAAASGSPETSADCYMLALALDKP
jgi:hypothetical protein